MGAELFPLLPFAPFPMGVDLGSVLIVPNGGNVFYVRGNGTTVTTYDYDPPGIRERLIPSINTACSYCVSGRGDVVQVLEGHAETISNDGNAWSSLKAGTKIVGRGNGTARPVITFAHANAQIDIAVANVLMYNIRLLAAGPAGTTAVSVANPLNVTAAGFKFINCEAEVGVDADQLCTNFIKLAVGAKHTTIMSNKIYGALASEITTVITTTGAVDHLKIQDNTISAAVATAATGVLFDLSNAAILENDIFGNRLENKKASSKYVIKPHATSTGMVDGNLWITDDGGTAPAVSGWTTLTTTYKFGENKSVTAVSVSGLLSPAVDS